MDTSSGAMRCSTTSMACSAWLSGMYAKGGWFWRAIRLESSCSTTESMAIVSISARRCAPFVPTMSDKPEIDPTSVNLFLRYRYTPSPYTILKGVRKLAPGTKLVIQNGFHQLSRWYRFRPTPFAPTKSPGEAREELLTLYKEAVRRQLISDVPVGLLLSGGVDSGLLLALMNLNGSSWPTYTVGYGSIFADDELADASQTARILGSTHTAVTITKSTFEETLPKIVACLEEPIASSSIVPMYFVCERARQDVKVALVGQGPDELFGGYRRHLGVRYGSRWARLPSWIAHLDLLGHRCPAAK